MGSRRIDTESSAWQFLRNPFAKGWTFVLAVFVLSRLLFLGVGVWATVTLPYAETASYSIRQTSERNTTPGFLDYWAHWDGGWYANIAIEGYRLHDPARTAFFPLYPMLVRTGTVIGGGLALWGVLISIVATLFALYFLYWTAEGLLNARAARAATLAFAFFPMAFFLNTMYTEALFVAFTVGSFWAAYVRQDLFVAGILGALAAATRNLGVLLLIPLGYEWLRNRQEFGWRGVLGVGLVPVGLLGYMAFLWYRFGDPLLSFRQQNARWNRELANPLDTLYMAGASAREGMRYVFEPLTLFLDQSPIPSLAASNAVNLAFFILLVFLMCICFIKLPLGLSVYAFLATMLPILTPDPWLPLMSLPRFMLSAFPLFVALGCLLSRSRLALCLWLIASSGLGVAFAAMFVTWRWVA
jgi:Mannosyltransferase (PIG-V)